MYPTRQCIANRQGDVSIVSISSLYDSNELSEILNSEVWNNSLTQEENQNI